MKNPRQRLLSILMALSLLLGIGVVSAPASLAYDTLTCVIEPVNGMEMDVNGFDSVNVNVVGGSGSYNYQWSVGNSRLAEISPTGNGEYAMLRGLAEGSTTITVRVTDNSTGATGTDTISLTVNGADADLVCAIDPQRITMPVGEISQAEAVATGGSGSYRYQWSTANSSVASVSGSGSLASVTAVGAGSTTLTLTVTDSNGRTDTDTISVTVERAVEDLTVVITPVNGMDVSVGGTGNASVDVRGGSGNYSYSWSVGSGSIASVTGSGSSASVTGRSAGSTTITVRVTDNSTGASGTDTISLTVTASSLTVVITPVNGLDVGVNGTGNASVDVRGGSGNYSYSWSVGSGSIASVTGSGSSASVTGRTAGSTTITVRVTDNSTGAAGTDTISLTVTASSLTVVITPVNGFELGVDGTGSASVDVRGGSGNYSYQWSTANTRIATVTATGNGEYAVVRGAASGDTELTVRVTDNSTGAFGTDTIAVTVFGGSSGAVYNPTDSCTLSASYLSMSNVASDIADQFYRVFSLSLANDADLTFSSAGTSCGTLRVSNGNAVRANAAYAYSDLRTAYFEPSAVGTFSIPYAVAYRGYTLSGSISIRVTDPGLTVTMNPTSLRLETYSSHYLDLDVTPRSARYTVSWSTSNSRIATVSGGGSSVTIETHGTTGTATIEAVVTNSSTGAAVTKRCTVTVPNSSSTSGSTSTYNPTTTASLGSNLGGTSVSDSIINQFRSVFSVSLPDSANITFSSLGNAAYGVLRLSNGNAIQARTSYTITQLKGMYFDPAAAGTYALPYTINYSGKTMQGTISIVVSAAQINTAFAIGNAAYAFNTAASNGSTAASLLSGSINSVLGSTWQYIIFNGSTSGVGTLYLNSSKTALGTSHVTASGMSSLYFVPAETGIYDVSFIVYSSKGNQMAVGTLFITVNNSTTISFTDVPANSYYAAAVQWAVNRGVTNGYTPTIFGPTDTCTRGQVATFLWRANGTPEPRTTTNPFKDVDPSSPFYKAILWAYENGITNGTTATTFDPSGLCTRGHTITFLWRAKNQPAANGTSAVANANPGRFFTSAAAWADTNQILTGVGGGTFNGDAGCPRSDIVTYIYRAYQ